jgi:hypothetical protein
MAWNSSFVRVKTNCQAIMKRGWGPWALNYNALCHPEVLTSKPGSTTNKTELSALQSKVMPEQLNLTDGLTGTLVDKIFVHKAKESENTGNNAIE